MKAQLFAFGFLIGLPLASLAQGPALPQPPATFYTPDFQLTTPADTTAYCAETTFRDSLAAVTRVYYPSGALRQYIPYSNAYRQTVHGTLTTWYEDGRMRTKEDFYNGQRHGDLLTYYPDGTLKRRDHYEKGLCGIGNCYGPNGAPVPYFIYEQLPLYPGGEAQLTKELAKGVRLTPREMDAMRRESAHLYRMARAGLNREVDVELLVGEDGRIANAKVVKSSSSFLNEAALRAVAKLKRQFVPARRDGQTVQSRYTVPVYYTMELPARTAGGAYYPRAARGW
ncbi:energy transducer TonB [Hymenobacter convexus]|uniref:energy transducer TonB n=1 Tax=Hymenobacter sp. CA1UV-4 TaxID=3063782 RepID=UPI0027127F80|nr:energy transducer TonB [Hymenobacter sp. CA1UV-4]MDO7852653.1 TonB family protein [Hymenobacter sp. CA1UV-4]